MAVQNSEQQAGELDGVPAVGQVVQDPHCRGEVAGEPLVETPVSWRPGTASGSCSGHRSPWATAVG
jgi:hypothetical protein